MFSIPTFARTWRVTLALVALLLLSRTDGVRGAVDPKAPAKEPSKVAKLDITKAVVLDKDLAARGFSLAAQPSFLHHLAAKDSAFGISSPILECRLQ